MTTRVHMWSGPRSMSTTVLYSFSNRRDCTALDEPLYAHYLASHPHLTRPYKTQLLEAQSPVGETVVQELLEGPCATPLLFCKHMAKQVVGTGLSMAWTGKPNTKHLILIRDPVKLISSWAAKETSCGLEMTLEETGMPQLLALKSLLRANGVSEDDLVVVDADDIMANPVCVLAAVCARLGVDFAEREMLSWEPGPKAFDGIWAPFWYEEVHKSTGFRAPSEKPLRRFPPKCMELLEEALPFYAALRRSAVVIEGALSSISVHGSGSSTMLARGSAEVIAKTPDPRNLAPGLLGECSPEFLQN